MTYLLPIAFIVLIVFALKKYQGMNKEYSAMDTENFRFYNEESLQIAKSILPAGEDIAFIDSGMDKDKEFKSSLGMAASRQRSGSTSGDFKYLDYLIMAKTATDMYFIPAKITGITKYTFILNPIC